MEIIKKKLNEEQQELQRLSHKLKQVDNAREEVVQTIIEKRGAVKVLQNLLDSDGKKEEKKKDK